MSITSPGTTPTRDERRSPREHAERSVATARLVALALGVGVLFDLAVRRPGASAAATLLVIGTSAALFASGRLESRASRVLIATAPVFGVWAMVRDSPWLVPLDLLAALLLMVAAVSVSKSGRVLAYGFRDLTLQSIRAASDSLGVFGFLRRGLGDEHSAVRRRLPGLGRGLLVGLPVLVVLLSLFASGDPLTGALLAKLSVGTGIERGVTISFGALAVLTLLFRASKPDDHPTPAVSRHFGTQESIVALGCITSAFAAFVALQVVGAFGVAELVLDDAARTSQWARQGFFQLLWAAGITLVALLAIDAVTRVDSVRSDRIQRHLAAACAVLTLVVVGLAIYRLIRYSEAFGLTMLRIYSTLFALWIGALFLLLVVRFLRPGPLDRAFLPIGSVLGLTLLFGLNVANPEALVVRWDTQYASTVDVRYLTTSLSADAVPALVASLDDVEEGTAHLLTESICDRHVSRRRVDADDSETTSGLSWNHSRASAESKLDELCER